MEILKTIQCGTCGVVHAIPLAMYEGCRAEGGFWHCPNGHSRGFGTGTLQAERDRLKQKVAQLYDEIREEQTAREKAKKQLSMSKKRALAGVCPCCNRTFNNVQRHMKTKHPEMALAT